MFDLSLPALLSIVTLVAVLGFGFFQLRRVRASQARRHETPGGMAGPSTDETP